MRFEYIKKFSLLGYSTRKRWCYMEKMKRYSKAECCASPKPKAQPSSFLSSSHRKSQQRKELPFPSLGFAKFKQCGLHNLQIYCRLLSSCSSGLFPFQFLSPTLHLSSSLFSSLVPLSLHLHNNKYHIMDNKISTRVSIRWLPDAASEPTDTLVFSVGGWYMDLRILKEDGSIDWAMAGERVVTSKDPRMLSISSFLGGRVVIRACGQEQWNECDDDQWIYC